MKKNVIVGQSGGPTAVINCSLYGVVTGGYSDARVDKVYGMVNGIEGFLKGKFLDFRKMKEDGSLEKLTTTPGAFLGACRYKLPEDLDDPVYPEILKKLDDLNVGYFCYIGGNDSMDTVSKLSRYAAKTDSRIRFMGVPKTIDNDLVLTDHTPGYGSAARYVAETVREIVYDAAVYNTKAVTIVEIMGRDAGWLTAASVLAREEDRKNPGYIYLPEVDFDTVTFLEQVKRGLEVQNSLVVCVSEGLHDAAGRLICEYDSETGVDSFGHKMLAGCGKYLERLVRERLGVKVRSVELNVCQRCSAAMMSETDRQEAVQAGAFAVRSATAGETGKMVACRRKTGTYGIDCVLEDVNLICNQVKKVPLEWIINDGSDLAQAFIDYAYPLIQGSVAIPVGADGLPAFIKR
ncbi:MAG: 6-phosphofructokinase [Eubacterium sp.]|nr:6-phosphofructokinase [Eubacterium sp.]